MKMQKLLNIQRDLKAPKSQYNSFGKYNYRNCEDILEAVKPLCAREKACLTLSDALVIVGERYYVQASATLYDSESGEAINTVTAYARESESKAGMDASQITGSASSYARKYALNGLFDIDDTKDADADAAPPKKGVPAPKEMGATNRSNAEEKAVRRALTTSIRIAGKEYALGGIPLGWLQSHVDRTEGELKEAMQTVIRHKQAEENKNSEEGARS